jgi:hypothetical protein
MKRAERLQLAKNWILKYVGKTLVSDYGKRFAVDDLCAIKELQMLGIEVSAEYIAQAVASQRESERQNALSRERKKQEKLAREQQRSRYGREFGYDDYFGFIAGYTSNGVAFGIPRDEWSALEKTETALTKTLHQDDQTYTQSPAAR